MAAFTLTEIIFVRHKFNIIVNLDIILSGYITFLLWEEFKFDIQPATWEPKLCHLLFLFSKVSSAASNVYIVTLINLYFILIILIMAQMSSELHGMCLKLKTTQPNIVYNNAKMRIMD